jgi:hypothetical protein
MKDYHSSHMVEYEEMERVSYQCLEVLPCLKGKKWNEVALAYVHSLRPTSIRVTKGETKLDARTWRVTVYVDNNDTIERIEQEVEVGLPDGVIHGEALKWALRTGIDSEQTKWFLDSKGTMLDCVNGGRYYKFTEDGKTVEFPYPEQKK